MSSIDDVGLMPSENNEVINDSEDVIGPIPSEMVEVIDDDDDVIGPIPSEMSEIINDSDDVIGPLPTEMNQSEDDYNDSVVFVDKESVFDDANVEIPKKKCKGIFKQLHFCAYTPIFKHKICTYFY